MENSHLKVININETGLAKRHQALSSWVGSGHKTILLRNVICVQTSALLRNASFHALPLLFLPFSFHFLLLAFLLLCSSESQQCYRHAVKLLSSLSEFQVTRKTWRRETFDLFLANNFFVMDTDCLQE